MPQKVALITAGGSGMGAATARELAEKGYKVAITSSSGKGERLGRELGGIGFTESRTDPSSAERIVEGTLAALGRIDVLVNSCGPIARGDLLSISDDEWLHGSEMILFSIIRLVRLVTPIFERNNGGAIVNISTFAAFEPDLRYPVSSTMRTALASFTRMYAQRYAAANIRMNNVLPGFILTKSENDAAKQQIPMKRYGSPSEVAKAIAFLVSDEAAYITGENIRIDGGLARAL